MVDADVYIFDEPLNGLDRTTRRTFYEELRKLHQHLRLLLVLITYLHIVSRIERSSTSITYDEFNYLTSKVFMD